MLFELQPWAVRPLLAAATPDAGITTRADCNPSVSCTKGACANPKIALICVCFAQISSGRACIELFLGVTEARLPLDTLYGSAHTTHTIRHERSPTPHPPCTYNTRALRPSHMPRCRPRCEAAPPGEAVDAPPRRRPAAGGTGRRRGGIGMRRDASRRSGSQELTGCGGPPACWARDCSCVRAGP